jgi:electron transfer flavoprotein beta subunit
MRALVGVKRVIDYTVKIRVNSDKTGVEKKSVKHSINPFCEIAIEEAVRLKEKGIVSHITSLSIGDKKSLETIRTSLALGADEAIHIMTDSPVDSGISSLTVINVLKHFIEKNNYQLVLLGKQSIDSDFNHTAQMLSGLMNWPLITFANKIEGENDNKRFSITREIDTGLQRLTVQPPFVLSCDLRLNTPRYSTLKNITAVRESKIFNFI